MNLVQQIEHEPLKENINVNFNHKRTMGPSFHEGKGA
jgi:hypothetical protein